MPNKKSNGGGGGDAKIGETVAYQPIRRDWLRGGGWPVPGIIQSVNEDAQTADLTIFPTPGTVDFVHACKYGDADGQYMKPGEESKTYKALKQAMEDAKKAAEEKAKKDEEEAKKAQEEAQQSKTAGGIPTIQAQLDQAHHIADMQYRYPQPQPEK